MSNKLLKIKEKYEAIQYNEDNYYVGGGLTDGKFASNRHEDAKSDAGKLTLGQTTQLFRKATDLDIDLVRSIIEYAVPNMEWHHAGKLPKQYGGGMKKTYFVNAKEIVDIAINFETYREKLELRMSAKNTEQELKRQLEIKRHDFLTANATKVVRIEDKPQWFMETDREMNGKYGWFSSYGKSYNMKEYYTGWRFENEEKYKEYLSII